ncbi:LPS export ABC transporter periplasmic protein LptC [Amphritea sp. HPY]|uniref:LPS export ABC transporter periplasmic protein LptC n=1 Tax=Amphritea sp. HPY TaxID=3421652 RepID=UPI003D7DF164
MLTGRARLATAALILTPVLIYQGLDDKSQKSSDVPEPSPAHQQSDFYIIDAAIDDYSVTGQLKQKLRTSQLEHQPQLQQVLTVEPQLTLFATDREPVTLSSLSGVMSDQQDIVNLAGSVTIQDHPDSQEANIMTTESLMIFPDKGFAETDKKVTLSNKMGKTTGVGMKTTFDTRTIELRSQVKGIHNVN